MSEIEDTGTTAGADEGGRPDPGVPRWVKVFIAVATVLIALFVATQFIAGGHGPGRHGAGDAPATEDGGHRSPVDHAP